MPDNSHDPQTDSTLPDEQAYTHLPEVRALRCVLARLEAQLDQVSPDDTAMLLRLANAMARLSDSIVRALAAHHKLQVLAEKNSLQQQWDDLKAARDVGALFFPVNPGAEEESWALFVREGLDRFLAKQYAGAYEQKLIEAFMKLLPDTPPWK